MELDRMSNIWPPPEIESFEHMSLECLEDKIHHLARANIPRAEILSVLMAWFSTHIRSDALSDGKLLEKFLEVLLLAYSAESDPTGVEQIDCFLKHWFATEAAGNSMFTRRYLFVEQAVQNILEKNGRAPPRPAAPLSHNDLVGQQEEHTRAQSEGDDYGHWNNSGADRVTITAGHSRQQCPSATYNKGTDEEMISSLLSKTTMGPERKPEAWGGTRDTHMLPPPNYVCRRCSIPGHLIQFCPTNLDPSFDMPPPMEYCCKLCGQAGAHFIQLCPRNSAKSSLTQQRKRLNIVAVSDGSPIYGGRVSAIARARGRSRSRSPDRQYSSRSKNYGRLRSRSPRHRNPSGSEEHGQSDDDGRVHQLRLSRPDGKKMWACYIDWDKEQVRDNEGRLAYDDVTSSSSPFSPRSPRSPHPGCIPQRSYQRGDRGEVSDSSEDRHGQPADFLDALAAELQLAETTALSADDSDESMLGPRTIRVQCPPFSPATAAFFRGRSIPVIHPKVNRPTASDMIELIDRRNDTL